MAARHGDAGDALVAGDQPVEPPDLSGDRFALWKGHFFIGALSGQQLQRVAFNQPGPQTERREPMLVPLDARVRDVRQAPEGAIYIAVERDTQLGPGSTRQSLTGSVLRLDPAPPSPGAK